MRDVRRPRERHGALFGATVMNGKLFFDLALRSRMAYSAIGIDLGGTTCKGAIMSADGASRHITRIPTEARRGGERVLHNILRLIGALLEKEGSSQAIAGVGIGSPGFVDADGEVLGGAENLPGWKGMRIFDPIREQFGLKVTASNDVTVAALAEFKFGAGRNADNAVCFALGTGIGGGIVIDRKVYRGSHGMAGELGHIVVETEGLQCNCGQKGCVEQYASATGIVKLAIRYAGDARERTAFVEAVNTAPRAVTSRLVYDYVKQKDPIALQVHHTACEMLARACGIVCNTLSPDRIVLCGGVLKAGSIITDEVRQRTKNHCWKPIFERCEFAEAQLGEDAGVLGAAALALDDFAQGGASDR
jgi:glucokinase